MSYLVTAVLTESSVTTSPWFYVVKGIVSVVVESKSVLNSGGITVTLVCTTAIPATSCAEYLKYVLI